MDCAQMLLLVAQLNQAPVLVVPCSVHTQLTMVQKRQAAACLRQNKIKYRLERSCPR